MREQRTPSQEGAGPKWELERRRRRPNWHNTTTQCTGPLEPRKRAVRCGAPGLDSRGGPTSGNRSLVASRPMARAVARVPTAHAARSGGWLASARARAYRLPSGCAGCQVPWEGAFSFSDKGKPPSRPPAGRPGTEMRPSRRSQRRPMYGETARTPSSGPNMTAPASLRQFQAARRYFNS
jgi:hypothetical protein